jgi:hypothetical protein
MSASPDISVFLARSFRALRDLFIYLLPGATFLALASHAAGHHPGWPADAPAWFLATVLLGACYIAGTFITILAYLLVSAVFPRPGVSRTRAMGQQLGLPPEPSATAVEDLRLRHRFPALFEECDRLSLIAGFRLSLASALLAGGALMLAHALKGEGAGASHGLLALLGGVILFLNARSGQAVAAGALAAARETARGLTPPES